MIDLESVKWDLWGVSDKTNSDWQSSEHGSICGRGFIVGGQFVDIYDESIQNTRRFWNFDTKEEDEKKRREHSEMEARIRGVV